MYLLMTLPAKRNEMPQRQQPNWVNIVTGVMITILSTLILWSIAWQRQISIEVEVMRAQQEIYHSKQAEK